MAEVTLRKIIQGKKESSQSYINLFMQVIVEVEGSGEDLKCWIFENDLLRDHPFRTKIWRKKVKAIHKRLTMVKSYMVLEEKLSTRFNSSIKTHFS